jgi:hypothetical protein
MTAQKICGAFIIGASLCLMMPQSASAQSTSLPGSFSSSSSSSSYRSGNSQEAVSGVIQNIIQNVRDQLMRRRMAPAVAPLRFSGEDGQFDARDPFTANGSSNPFAALAYTKAYMKAPPPAPVSAWLYGGNLIGSGDKTTSFGTATHVSTITGAFDVTKIGIFTTSDALTFIGTGSGSWGHTGSTFINTSTPSTSGTLSYLNGGFSADFTTLASWTRSEFVAPFVGILADTSGLSYTGNVQYRFDLPNAFWIEPTVGFTYTEAYTANFDTKVSDSTEIHGGARIGTETTWMGYTVQPSISGALFQIVDSNAVGIGAVATPGLGGRGSGKLNVLWTPAFSSYVEVHGSGMSGTGAPSFIAATQTIGGQVGLRYTWN